MNIINESTKANDIINTLDPDQWQCGKCKKWGDGISFISLKEKSTFLIKICHTCWYKDLKNILHR